MQVEVWDDEGQIQDHDSDESQPQNGPERKLEQLLFCLIVWLIAWRGRNLNDLLKIMISWWQREYGKQDQN